MSAKNTTKGMGWVFPPSFNTIDLQPEMVGGEAIIDQSLGLLLGIRQGERPMSPLLGTNIQSLIFQQSDLSTLKEIEILIKQALINLEPRINVEKIKVDTSGMDEGSVLFVIMYTVRATNSRHNKVFPFYLKEGTLIADRGT